MPLYYPVFLDLRGRRVVVIGGGAMGEEKVTRLLPYEAQVVVVSRDVTDEVAELADDGTIEWVRRPYRRGDLDGAFIAIVADTSDDAVNQAVSEEGPRAQRAAQRRRRDRTLHVDNAIGGTARRGHRRHVDGRSKSCPGAAVPRDIERESADWSRGMSSWTSPTLHRCSPMLGSSSSTMGFRLNLDHWQACLTDELIDLVQDGDTSSVLRKS